MKPHILLLTSNLPLPSLNLPFRKRKSLPLAFLNRNTSIHFPRFHNPKFKVFEAVRFDCPVTDVTELEGEDCNLVLETCITRALPPALTLERGIESIKAAVVGLKSNPPCSSHGVFRFQVAVPPSPKALNWFCSLPESDGVFPRFFLSKETEDASFKNLYLHRTRGVFGLGSAICYEACTLENQKRIRRYLSSDSAHIMTYGFMDINFNKESSSIKHEAGSFYFFIPEVELDEQEEVSILVVTLAWDENFCWTFEQAIQSLESSIYQASCCFWPESCYSKCIESTLRNFNLMEGKTFQMACTDALFLDRRDYQADTAELVSPFSWVSRKPMRILVINNHGGAIFSLLPFADKTDPRILDQYFYTSHRISIQKLCESHSVRHLPVKTKVELQEALLKFEHEKTDCVIEVESCIGANSTFHSTLRKSAQQAANHALSILSRLSVGVSISDGLFLYKIHKMNFSLYKIQLCAPPTSSSADHHHNEFHREGYILSVYLEDGSVGYGEVAPLEIHKENLVDVEEQLLFLLHVIKGIKINVSLPTLKGSFTSWIWSNLGIMECSIFPSVRCGLEMAILNAIAVSQGSNFISMLQPRMINEEIYEKSSVKICALVDSNGTPTEVAYIASSLVEEGFTAIKLKVARQADPIQDAAVICKVRNEVGPHVELRVDANRKWTYEEAIQFGFLVKDCDLQYIEEPVENVDDIVKFCEETGLPAALDETIDNFQESHLNMLAKYTHPGIVAVVIKPSVIGGFEKAALIARWAQKHGKMVVVSAAFESGLGLSTYILFSYYLEQLNAVYTAMNREIRPSIAHGLGTYRWLKQDVTAIPIGIHYDPCKGFMGASVAAAIQHLQNFKVNNNVIHKTFNEEQAHRYHLTVNSKNFSHSIKVHEVGQESNDNVVIFLHGFLGTGEDWIPIMKAISRSAKCISIDLPGHGGSKI